MGTIARARVNVYGRVQGVFFRAETEREAVSLGLGGYVKNMGDGSVEAAFEGEKESVESAIEWCRDGPPYARVKSIDIEWETPLGDTEFFVKYY
ncbi:MAG: acylphosphatase [Actinobacteria bacterium]|nr:acylphosphatase [Actinomycetota bacterium]